MYESVSKRSPTLLIGLEQGVEFSGTRLSLHLSLCPLAWPLGPGFMTT